MDELLEVLAEIGIERLLDLFDLPFGSRNAPNEGSDAAPLIMLAIAALGGVVWAIYAVLF